MDLCRQVHGRDAEIRIASIAHDADDVAKAVASITGDRPEFRKNLEPLAAISTAHLRPDTLASLGHFCISYENDYGAFIYTVDVDGERARRADLPEDLRRLLEAAHEAGLVWVKLDGDAQGVEGLPQYPWP